MANTEFSPFNNIVKLCLQGMEKEEQGKPEDASKIFLQSWNEATNDFEKFLSAYFVARHQKTASDKLKWLEASLLFAIKVNDNTVKSAFPALYSNMAKCYEDLNNNLKAKEYIDLANSYKYNTSDNGPFYHGTKADLQTGDLLTAGGNSNYQSELRMNHIYFTAFINGAGLAAELAKGENEPRVYIIEPTVNFENDPNVTDKKFPGNPTRSYRSIHPLKVVGEVTDWVRQTPEEIQRFRDKLANNKGKIIN
jgi:rifampin ADP-ribosylating transferase